ncbi:MAG: hypothetical protein KGJ96_05520 [Xanthomonadaceae bacterium]|nr:hypothetical protein [Xanthomonadaceae bacterium]
MYSKWIRMAYAIAAAFVSVSASAAVTYTDNFSGATASLDWKALDYACLTAGNGTGTIPACAAPNDAAGSGALRLTPAAYFSTGAILSNFTFPSNQGMQVTFTTYTYGGDSGGTARDGADGISFFLTDGAQPVATTAGGSGGSMGYSCSNANGKYEGLANAYLGLGVDEFGNFLNSGDNTSTGIYNSNSAYGTTAYGSNTWSNNVTGGSGGGTGPFYQPMRIGLRGAGNVTWAALQALNPSYYSETTPNAAKVQAACKSGMYIGSDGQTGIPLVYDYNVIPGGYRVLPNTQPIADEGASTRSQAWPITYKLTLSPTGLLNFAYSYNNGAFQPVLVNRLITQNNPAVPSSFRFGFSAGTGGSDNVHEITCFQASPLQSNSSAGANTVQSGEVKTGTQIYLASYSADNWWGSLVSAPLVTTGGVLSVSSIANWDAKCVLTGGTCAALGTDASGNPISTTVEAPASRVLLTSDTGSKMGKAFEWTSLSSTQQATLNSSDNLGQQRLDWLRGGRSNEQLISPTGTLRNRVAVLGDIIDSSPTWVGAPSPGVYPDSFNDLFVGTSASNPENNSGATMYSAFVAAKATRTNVVYVGSNDGYLHGFEAGSFNTDGTYNSTTNDGKEVIGFMPSQVLSGSIVQLTSPTYAHNYYVDATPTASDLFYGNTWHTWLVGGVGSSGSEIYALDITDPGSFTEANASSLVMGDWTNATTGLSHLANTVGTPIIARLHNGQWAVIFGNGLGGTSSAGIYIGLVDSTTGQVGSFQFLDTKVGSASSPDGIAYVSSVDLDGDDIADYLYAGDTQGNVWRFDVTDKSPSKWYVSKFGNNAATPLFVAKDASGNRQPITTAVTVAAVATGSVNRAMVLFGTGKKTSFTGTSGDTYATGTQTFYGIWDWNMAAWNKVAVASAQYGSLAGTQAIARSNLLQQTVTSSTTTTSNGQVLGTRSLSNTQQVCWQGSSTCTSGNTQYGWYFDLPASGEQIIYSPTLIDGAVVVNTAIPPVISALQCNPGLQSGWTMAFDPASGGGLKEGFFPGADGSFGTGTSTVSGIQLNAVGTPTAVTSGGQTYLITQTVKGSAALSRVNPPISVNASRVSWKELTN